MVGLQYDDRCCVTCGEIIQQVLDQHRASLMKHASFEPSDLPRSTDLRLSGDESDGQTDSSGRFGDRPKAQQPSQLSHFASPPREGVTRAQTRSWRNG